MPMPERRLLDHEALALALPARPHSSLCDCDSPTLFQPTPAPCSPCAIGRAFCALRDRARPCAHPSSLDRGRAAQAGSKPADTGAGSRAPLHLSYALLRGRRPRSSARPGPHDHPDRQATEFGALEPRPHGPRACSFPCGPVRYPSRSSFLWDRPCYDDRRHGAALRHAAPSTLEPHAPPVAGAPVHQCRLLEPRSPPTAHHHPNTLTAEVTCHLPAPVYTYIHLSNAPVYARARSHTARLHRL